MSIEKAMLLKKSSMGATKVLDVMFNPETYTIDNKLIFKGFADSNNPRERLFFTELSARTLSLELLFDSTNVWSDSSAATLAGSIVKMPGVFSKSVNECLNLMRSLIELDDQGRPPIITFSWSSFAFTGVIETMKETMTEFSAGGIPVKAKVSVTIKECAELLSKAPPTADVAKAAAGALASSQEQNLEATITAAVSAV